MQLLAADRRNVRALGFIVAALGWLWLTMLAVPFGNVIGLISTQPILIYLAFLFLCDSLFGPIWLRIPAKLMAIVFFIFRFYYDHQPFFSLDWLENVSADALHSVEKVGTTAFDGSTPGQMLVLLALFWLGNAIVYKALRHRWAVFTLLLVGESSLGMMDAFYTVSVSVEVFVFFIVGLFLMAATQFGWLTQTVALQNDRKLEVSEWFVSAVVISGAIGILSLSAPKAGPSWPDPFGWWSTYGPGGSPIHRKVGYGNNDTQLGGPFLQDNAATLQVNESQGTYLRGESRDLYTGHGWESGNARIIRGEPGQLPFNQMESESGFYNLPFKQIQVKIKVLSGSYDVFLAPYEQENLNQWSRDNKVQGSVVPLVDLSGYRVIGGPLQKGDVYTVTSDIPTSDAADYLKKVPATSKKEYPSYVQQDLQLPSTMPARVQQLAVRITSDMKGPYNKVVALRDYLQNNYTYETTDVPVPAAGQDFVDQFLFDSHRGYCDHFSSAMVVMARELGIPARWVKGFAIGDLDTTSSAGDQYIVQNKDAHSWVEVYFKGYGWYPFDPTPTFNFPVAITNIPLPNGGGNAAIGVNQEKHDTPPVSTTHDSPKPSPFVFIGVLAGTVVVLLTVVWFVAQRKKILLDYRVSRWERFVKATRDVAIVRAVLYLLKIFAKFGWRRQQYVTLREFGDDFIRGIRDGAEQAQPAITHLTVLFEEARYGERMIDEERYVSAKQWWKDLLSVVMKTSRKWLRQRGD